MLFVFGCVFGRIVGATFVNLVEFGLEICNDIHLDCMLVNFSPFSPVPDFNIVVVFMEGWPFVAVVTLAAIQNLLPSSVHGGMDGMINDRL